MVLNLVPRSSLQSLLHLTRFFPYRYVWREDLKQGPHQVGRGKLGKTEFAALTKDFLSCSPRQENAGNGAPQNFLPPAHPFPHKAPGPRLSWDGPDNWGSVVSSLHQATARPRVSASAKTHWTSVGRRAHLPTPVWNVCWKKNHKCVCHEEEASAVPIRATLPFSKAPRAQHLGFSAPPQKCIWREMTSGEQSLKAVSCLPRKERWVTSSFPQADDLSSL